MRAMILAAGLGSRMGHLTAEVPKPLLKVNGRYLIEYTIANLQRAGMIDIVVNVSYRGEQIQAALGNGERYGVKLTYSEEAERLETGGGIYRALPWLGDQPFVVVSSDIITDFSFSSLHLSDSNLAHLVLVANPSYKPEGDFSLHGTQVSRDEPRPFTFANIGVYHPDLFKSASPGYFPLSQLLFPAVQQGKVTGEVYQGAWFNIGTPEELTQFIQATSVTR